MSSTTSVLTKALTKVLTRLAKLTLVLMLVCSFLGTSLAQAQTDSTSTTTRSGPRRQLATILFAGLGGAVIGLSTLSFYGRPQDHLSNIALGFAGGVILGTTIVTYRAATNPTDFYGTRPQVEKDIALTQRSSVHPLRAPTFAMNFEF